jgi:hypothetical protein
MQQEKNMFVAVFVHFFAAVQRKDCKKGKFGDRQPKFPSNIRINF